MHQPTLSEDQDLHRLINLLAMLPGPDDIAFWNGVDTNGRIQEADEADDHKPTGDGYLIGKMEVGIRNLLHEPHAGNTAYFCEYLLKFFDGDRPTLWRYLNNHVAASGFSDQAGERWTRDLCDTAWRLTVRYDRRGKERLAEKWPLR